MSNLGPMPGRGPLALPTPPRGETIARYPTYLEAQRAVDFLSDNKFPVQFVTIVGTGLRMVERVTGRLTYSKVALAGAASGAYFGAMIGLVLLFIGQGTVFLPAVILGAGFGLLFSLVSYSLTGGRRDFTSTSQVVATEYEVLCLPEHASGARELLARLPGGRGRPGGNAAATVTLPQDQPASAPPSPSTPAGTTSPPPWGSPAPTGEPVPGEPPATVQQPVTGPTYGEMIEKQRRERAEKERAEREGAAGRQGD